MPPHQLNYGNQLSSDSFVEVSTLSIRELKTSQRVLMLEKYILLLDILAKVNEIVGQPAGLFDFIFALEIQSNNGQFGHKGVKLQGISVMRTLTKKSMHSVWKSLKKSHFYTVFENHWKSLIQHCEQSELRLHFEWTKHLRNAENGPIWRVFENLLLAVKQSYQTIQFL